MATTTNYSWTTPDDTDLVKDGASAIRTLGTAIDSTVFTNAGAAINKSIVDAAGDLIYGTADNTVARLAIGTADQVLKVNSGATAPEWGTAPSGGMTLISTTTLSGSSVSLTSIPQTYNNLQLVIKNFKPATDTTGLNIRYNEDSASNRHAVLRTYGQTVAQSFNSTSLTVLFVNNDNVVDSGFGVIDFFDYKNTTSWKISRILTIGVDSTTTTQFTSETAVGLYNQTAAITSFSIFPSSGNFTSGTALLYGVK